MEIFATDYSSKAVDVVKYNPLYQDTPVGKVHAGVWDLSSDSLPEGVEPGSVDVVVMIFVLSALHPTEWTQAVANIYRVSTVRPLENLHLCDIDAKAWR